MWFLKAPYYHLGFLAVLRPNPAPHKRSSSGPKSLMVSLGWLYLEGYFSPLAPRGRALQQPSSHTCLESAQCFTPTLPCASIHAQAGECPRVVQTSGRGNGFALYPDMFPFVKKGFCSGISVWNFYSLFSADEGIALVRCSQEGGYKVMPYNSKVQPWSSWLRSSSFLPV